MECIASLNRSILAKELGAFDTILCLCARNSQGDLHNQRYRITKHVVAQSDQESGLVPQRRVDAQITVSSAEQYRQEMDDAYQRLEGGLEPFLHSLWRQNACLLKTKPKRPFTQNYLQVRTDKFTPYLLGHTATYCLVSIMYRHQFLQLSNPHGILLQIL